MRRSFSRGIPVVSLRSTTGYDLFPSGNIAQENPGRNRRVPQAAAFVPYENTAVLGWCAL
jgi:hypothetical protein